MKKFLSLMLACMLLPTSTAMAGAGNGFYSRGFSKPNIFGGYTYYQKSVVRQTYSNNIGGYRYFDSGRYLGQSRKNIYGGETFFNSSGNRK